MDSSIIFSLIVIFSLLVSSEACHPVDKEALLHFKHQIIFDPYNLLQSWTLSSDCCTDWDGVSCDYSKRVVNMSRPGGLHSYMTGNLSSFLANLSNLQHLDFSNLKDLKGPIPPEFGNLQNLETLVLSRNQLSGPIPKSLGKLTKLRVLELQGNGLSGNIPVELGDAKALTTILLSNNKLSGGIPENVMNLKNLKDFDVSGNSLSDRVPPHKAIFLHLHSKIVAVGHHLPIVNFR
ncbi:DNA damage-repair/toleration protein DRT100-like [Mangifera indica]|uniref:DNA damage-repair/toleration protein DRT100-like n=1 Tax=Mangifera indica TaxID=29780 RepID=UPI001CFB8C8B|nr:DNA damage-repair/toleration protein DRT100-like [Mangifera indica]